MRIISPIDAILPRQQLTEVSQTSGEDITNIGDSKFGIIEFVQEKNKLALTRLQNECSGFCVDTADIPANGP